MILSDVIGRKIVDYRSSENELVLILDDGSQLEAFGHLDSYRGCPEVMLDINVTK